MASDAENKPKVFAFQPADVAYLLDKILLDTKAVPLTHFGFKNFEVAYYNFYLRFQNLAAESHAQIAQDLWVAFLLNCWEPSSPFSQSGFFVEFGALDGESGSNSLLFERRFGWKGILAEPNPQMFEKCQAVRSAIIDSRCVWARSGETLSFNTVPNEPGLGTIETFENSDPHQPIRLYQKNLITCETVSLVDLLREHDAPPVIDYLSVDTEGSELEILSNFDFTKYAFRVITVEHNFTPAREQIHSLLTAKGYMRLPRSVQYFDDTYVNRQFFPMRD